MRLTPEQAEQAERDRQERVNAYIERQRPLWPQSMSQDEHSEDL